NLLARRSYEADAYLADSPQLLFRLYHTSLDLGKEQEAVRWCDAGFARFPENWQFTFCQLTILAGPGPPRPAAAARAAVARAWKLVAQLQRVSRPEERAPYVPRWEPRLACARGRP